MKLKIIPENLLEWIALKLNLAPTPLVDTQVAFNAARAIMAAADLGIYEAIGKGTLTAEEITEKCKTNLQGTKHLLNCLVGVGYLKWNHGQYSLKPKYYKWLLKEYDSNVVGKLRYQITEWNFMAKLEEYVRTGNPVDMHGSVTKEQWVHYQEGMRDLSVNASREVAKKIPIPDNATSMLDIGGAHGLFSIELCKRHSGLSSTILELPGAIDSASAIAKRYDKKGQLKYIAGNALSDDLGQEQYDLVMINNVVHHFTAEQNKALAVKVARALKPNGLYTIGDFIRSETPGEGGVLAATSGLFFSVASQSGAWSVSEIESWQKAARAKTRKINSGNVNPRMENDRSQKEVDLRATSFCR